MVEIATGVALSLVQDAVADALKTSLQLGWRKLRWWPVILLRRNEPVRVVCSAFVRILDHQGRYLVIKNSHREFYGPPGGCYQYRTAEFDPSRNSFFFESDGVARLRREDRRDLRGYIKRRCTAQFFEWFHSGKAREGAHECLSRELREELFIEQNEPPIDYDSGDLEYRFVRAYLERSRLPRGRLQFRFFEIYDLVENDGSAPIRRWLAQHASANFAWVASEEIVLGRHRESGHVLGHATELFISDELTREDLPIAVASHGAS